MTGPAQWRPSAPGTRLVAAAASVALTVGGIALLRTRHGVVAPPTRPQAMTVRILPAQIRVPAPPIGVTVPALPRPARRVVAAPARRVTAGTVAAAPPAEIRPPVAATEAASPIAPGEPSVAASGALRLDARTLGRAAVAAEGNVRRMARESGTTVDSPRVRGAEALGAEVAKTGVWDCLGPNPNGSLLSIPLIAFSALADKCK